MPNHLPYSQACENNKDPILEKLHQIFDAPGKVLEIGTLTGQHAAHFARAMPHLQWQPTDHPDAADLCVPRLKAAALPNVLPVKALDVTVPEWPIGTFDWAFSANTAHIMAWQEVTQMFQHIGHGLAKSGAFCLYGPFNDRGEYTSDSNRQFDRHLRAQAAHMGIRDLTDLVALGESVGLSLTEVHPMPANNQLLVFRAAPTR